MPTPKGDIEKPVKNPWEMDFSAEPSVEPSLGLKPWEMDFTAEAEPRPAVTPALTEAMAGFSADKSPDTAIEVLDFHKETGFNKDFIEKNLDVLKDAKFKRGAATFAKNAPATNEFAIASVYHGAVAREDEKALTSIEGKVRPRERDIFDVAGEIAEDPATLLPFIGQGIEFKEAVGVLKAAARQASRTELRERIAAGRGIGEEGERFPEGEEDFRRTPLLDIEEDFELFGPIPVEPRLAVPSEEEDIALLLPLIERAGAETTIAGGVLDIAARAPAFLVEFLFGGEVTKPLKPIITRALGKSLEKVFTKAGRAGITKRAVELGITATAGAGRFAVATPLILGPTIAKNTLENASPGFRFTQKETGELGVILTDEGDDALVALAKGFGDSFVEVLSERSGGIFNVAGSAIKKQVANVAIKSSFVRALFKANPDKNPREVLSAFKILLKRAGWNGILAEVAEEEVAKAGKFVIGTQEYNLTTRKELITMIIGFGVIGGGLSAIGGTLEKIAVTRDVERKADIVKEIGEDVKESKLHKRSPELFAEVVDRMAEGTEMETVAIPVEQWDKHFEELEIDPREISEELLGDATLYDTAVNEGNDIEMSFGTYAAGIAATEHNEALSEELKISGAIDVRLADELLPEAERPEPPPITPAREARIESERLRKELAEAVEKARVRTEAILEGQIPTESERIVQDVTTQLEAAGINTEDARLQAEILYGEPFRLLAERAGLTPEELFEEFGPTIRRTGVAEVAEVEEAEIFEQAPKQTSKAFKSWFKDSKVVNEKGKPKPVFHGTAEDFEAFDPERSPGGLFWFTDSREAIERGEVGAAGRGVIQEVYLSLQNPAGREEYDKFFTDELIAKGFDGIILEDEDGTTYVAFEPTQIKSVKATKFDPEDPRILFQAKGRVFEGNVYIAPTREAAEALNEAPPELVADAKALQTIATKKQKTLESILDTVVTKLDLDGFLANVKSVKSVVDKVTRKNDPLYTVTSMKDHTRGTLLLKDFGQIQEVIDALAEKLDLRGEAFIDPPLNMFGYRGVHLSADMGEGIQGEIQIHTTQSWELKKESDNIYSRWRDFTDVEHGSADSATITEYERDIQKSYGLWTDFWGSISEEVKLSTSAAVNGLAPAITPKVSVAAGTQAPSVKTKAGLPSDIGRISKTRPSGSIPKAIIETPPIDNIAEDTRDVNIKRDETAEKTLSQAEKGKPPEGERLREGAGPRASITFGPTGVSIDLFKKDDPSSLFHETGHLYLRILDDLAQREGASEDLKQDHQAVLDWLGAKPGAKLTVAQQEKWARGIELYFREGNAPTSALREAFARFKEWFLSVYESVLQLNVELSPEIRSVMDRLLASREDIDDISNEVDRAVIDLVTEGKAPEDITNADIEELVPEYKPPVTSKIKKDIRDTVGLNKKPGLALFELISKDKDLEAAFKKSLKAAKAAFKAGKKAGVAKENKRMNEIAAKTKEKTKKKVDKILTEKEKIQRRKTSVRAIRDELGLSDRDITKLTHGRRLDLMSNYEFKEFKDRMLFQAESLVKKQIAKARVIGTIEELRLTKTENFRKALKLPTLKNMTTKQLDNWADQLDIFEEGDIFLGKRQIETADLTELKGARTHRQVLEILARKVSKREGRKVEIKELQKITPPGFLTKLSFDSVLMQRDPFFRMLVEETTKQLSEGELRAFEIEQEFFELVRASEKSQGRVAQIKGFVLPQDKQIMEHMEAEDADKERLAADMTVEQLKVVNFMQHYFEGGLEYLRTVGALERGRENYFTHLRQSFFESVKEGGFLGGFKDIVKNFTDDARVFTIIDTETGDILPLNKHFKFAMRRGEEGINPTQNVTKAFLVYVRTLEKKKSFDATFPALDMYVQALAPIQTTQGGVEMDRRFKKFIYEWLNNKKGRRFSFGGVIEQGRTLDLLLTGSRTFTTIRDLFFNLPVQIASIVGEQPANFIVLGAAGIVRGEVRQRTKKGQAIVRKHEAVLGRSAWQEFFLPGKELPERLIEAGFMIFHINTVKMNKQFFLASLTKEEYDTGEVSSQRVAEILLDMGRFRVVPGTESILGAASLGKSVNQYKGWAIRLLLGSIKSGETFVRNLNNKPLGEALTVKESREFYRIVMIAVITGIVLGAGEDEDDTFLGRIYAKSRREMLSLVQSWDPTMWTAWRTSAFVGDLLAFLKEAATFEEFKTKPGYKAVARGKRMITPAAIAPIFREDR